MVLEAELFDLKCHPILSKHDGTNLGHPCANVTLSECLSWDQTCHGTFHSSLGGQASTDLGCQPSQGHTT